MKKRKNQKYSHCGFTEVGKTLKALPMAILVGLSVICTPASASDSVTIDLSQKPIDIPTLNYLRDNNILIPQKDYQRDENGNLVLVNGKPVLIEGEPIQSPESAYTITEGTEENYSFEYKTADENGNIISKYYNINLRKPELNSNSSTFGTSKNITWHEVNETGKNTVTIKLPNNVTKYFQYNYNAPADYETIENQATTEFLKAEQSIRYYAGGALKVKEGETKSITNKLFINNKSSISTSNYLYGGALYNAGIIKNLTADFINNSVSSNYDSYGGAIYNSGTIENITGDFIGNYAYYSYGGAIDNNYGTIGNITGDFINNHTSYYFGGAIDNNYGTIGNITGDFINNYTSSAYNSSGGAIYNNYGSIRNITGDFINNYTTSSSYNSSGGAIDNNYGTIGNITGDFINNYTSSASYNSSGGAIDNNYGTIGNITGDFINNYASYGGAIDNNSGTIGNITGNFINNYTSSATSYSSGGAIYNNYGSIGNITGDFINNYTSYYFGGAIGNNSGTIGNITGNFINNSASYGGAIYNSGTIGEKDSEGKIISSIVNSNFYNNYVTSASGTAQGGAIWTNKDLNIIADNGSSTFKGNYAMVGDNEKDYTAIFVANKNDGFIYGDASDFELEYDGVVYSTANITTPTLNFLAKNNGQITLNDKIVGEVSDTIYRWNYSYEEDFSNDTDVYIETFRDLDINNNEISGYKYRWYYDEDDLEVYHFLDIDNNETEMVYKLFYGDNFQILDKDNKVIDEYSDWYYEKDDYDFYTHYLVDTDGNEKTIKSHSWSLVVALYTPEPTGYLATSSVNFSGDSTGVINIYNDIKNMNVNVDTVTINMADGKMHNYEFLKLTSDDSAKYIMDVDPTNNTSDKITTTTESEGVVTIGGLRVENVFAANPNETYKFQILDTQTDALQLALSDEIKSQTANCEYRLGFSGEEIVDKIKTATNWKDKYNISEKQTNIYGTVELDTTKTTNDSIDITITRIEKGNIVLKESQGDTLALWNSLDTEETKSFNFDSAKDIYIVAKDNPETLKLGETKGSELNVNGVIDEAGNRSTINLNYRQGFDVKDSTTLNINNVTIANGNGENGSVINVTNPDATINLTNVNLVKNTSSTEGGAIYSNTDVNITADNAVSEISGNYANDKNEAIYMANPDKTLTLNIINNGKLVVDDKINGEQGYTVDITGDSTGTVVLNNNINNAYVTMGNVTLNNINNKPQTMNFDKFTLTGDINFTADVDLENTEIDRIAAKDYGTHYGNINVIGMNLLSDSKEEVTSILFADKDLKDYITNEVKSIPQNKYQTVYSPIYKYNVSYDNREDGGYFIFNRGGNAGGNASNAFNPSILATPISSISASQATINETFKYAFEHADVFTKMPKFQRISKINANKSAISTDFNNNLGSLATEQNNSATWFTPYVTFENMHLKNGPKVGAITYGSLAGFDTDFNKHKNGWYSVGTGYVGYNGSLLSYSGVDTTMNGGLLGYTHTMYKDNFWSALTLTAGASVGESRTMYGKEDFTSLMAGIGSKTGYNFEFKEGRFIVQPIMFLSYTFVNTFDYTNAAGVKINASPAHSIMLNPSVRFIANTKNGWQPYASIGMVWNVMNKNKVMANNVRLPEMSMKPYVEYGLGIQRSWKDRFTAFGQTMIRNGGRNGVALTLGMRWTLGKDPAAEKVEVPNSTKKVILKQLTPKSKNTTRTISSAELKNL